MRYRVDTQSLRTAESNLLQVSSSLDTICVNIRNVQRNLSVRVRDNGDINHEFRFISQELSNLEKLIFKASRFLRESANSYEQVESRNLIDIRDDSSVADILCNWTDSSSEKPEDSDSRFDIFLDNLPIISFGISLGESMKDGMLGKGFVYNGGQGLNGLLSFGADMVTAIQDSYDWLSQAIDDTGAVKPSGKLKPDFSPPKKTALEGLTDSMLLGGIFSLIINTFSNLAEGNSPLRTIEEISMETIIDVLFDALIYAGMALVMGATPAGWAAVIIPFVVSLVTDIVVSFVAGEPTSFTEVCSDFILDGLESAAGAIGNAVAAAGDFFSDIGNGIAGWFSSAFA